jgi:hypothetical protein
MVIKSRVMLTDKKFISGDEFIFNLNDDYYDEFDVIDGLDD